MKIIDCTLREGNQAKQCSLNAEQSALLAGYLTAFGVDMIECGHPKISADEAERVRAVLKVTSVPVLAHARCTIDDVDAVLETGAPWIGVFAGVNDISIQTKFKKHSKEHVFKLFEDAIRYARERGLRVRATVEDAGRTSMADRMRLVQLARSSGADRVCLADSVGALLPSETYECFSIMKREFPDVVFEYHGHNDQGLALANSLEALRGGCDWVSTSCNGIGERAGITDTFQLATLLHTKYGQDHLQIKMARTLSELVEVYSRIPRSPMQPIVGSSAFVHAARLHQLAVQEGHQAYSFIDPKLLGSEVCLAKDPTFDVLDLFLKPLDQSTTELSAQRDGSGGRFVLLDRRLLQTSPYYFIARNVEDASVDEREHVEPHAHKCDAVLIFLGNESGYEGLTVEVSVGGVVKMLEGPGTVFIPAGARHSYRFIKGSGTFIKFVNGGDYNASLMHVEHEPALVASPPLRSSAGDLFPLVDRLGALA